MLAYRLGYNAAGVVQCTLADIDTDWRAYIHSSPLHYSDMVSYYHHVRNDRDAANDTYE